MEIELSMKKFLLKSSEAGRADRMPRHDGISALRGSFEYQFSVQLMASVGV